MSRFKSVFDASAFAAKWRPIMASWDDEHLQAVAYKTANKSRGGPAWMALLIEEFERRGLKPIHSYFVDRCDVCGNKALYRFARLAFCREHKMMAQHGSRSRAKWMDSLAAEFEASKKETEKLKQRMAYFTPGAKR